MNARYKNLIMESLMESLNSDIGVEEPNQPDSMLDNLSYTVDVGGKQYVLDGQLEPLAINFVLNTKTLGDSLVNTSGKVRDLRIQVSMSNDGSVTVKTPGNHDNAPMIAISSIGRAIAKFMIARRVDVVSFYATQKEMVTFKKVIQKLIDKLNLDEKYIQLPPFTNMHAKKYGPRNILMQVAKRSLFIPGKEPVMESFDSVTVNPPDIENTLADHPNAKDVISYVITTGDGNEYAIQGKVESVPIYQVVDTRAPEFETTLVKTSGNIREMRFEFLVPSDEDEEDWKKKFPNAQMVAISGAIRAIAKALIAKRVDVLTFYATKKQAILFNKIISKITAKLGDTDYIQLPSSVGSVKLYGPRNVRMQLARKQLFIKDTTFNVSKLDESATNFPE